MIVAIAIDDEPFSMMSRGSPRGGEQMLAREIHAA
jgi:hypothetical protein